MKQRLKHPLIKLLRVAHEALFPEYALLDHRNKLLLSEHMKHTYGDQKGQVSYLINNVLNYEEFGLKRNGFFVDLACADGVTISNTYFLEKHLGWTGLLFEPNPVFHESIEAHRSSHLVAACVTDNANDAVRFRIDNGMLGGIVSDETDNNERFRGSELKDAEIIEVTSTTLEIELDKIKAPEIIDFLSLDVEGAEWIVLRSFNFNRYKFVCMAIERPNELLDMMLEQNGYRQVAHLAYDVIYVHKDFLENVNFKPNIKFSFTPRKDW